jgi:hypothetical protein
MSDMATVEHNGGTHSDEQQAINRAGPPTQALMCSGLPPSVKALILAVLRTPNGCDQCLMLADALYEIGTLRKIDDIDHLCWFKAADALRELAMLGVAP